MEKLTIERTVEAWQWDGKTSGLPAGFHVCQPEVHYSASHKEVYFTYADLRATCWISTEELPEVPTAPFMGSVYKVTRKDGSEYFRQVFPFFCWSIKSEASVKRDHRAVFLDRENQPELRAFLDFVNGEGWCDCADGVRSLPPRVEYRQIDGAYGRGYRPYYLKPGDWLLIDGDRIEVKSNEEFSHRPSTKS